MSGKPLPEPDVLPWYTRMAWRIWAEWITYPWQARQLRKAGFRRTGWRQWELP